MQPEKDIYSFKKGDKLTRLLPIVDEDGFKDFSLVGAKLTFIGIANACVYLSKRPDIIASIFLGKMDLQIKLPLAICLGGWAEYIEPEFLNGEVDEEENLDDIEYLEKGIQEAVNREDFVKAAVLKQRIEDIKKKEKDKTNE